MRFFSLVSVFMALSSGNVIAADGVVPEIHNEKGVLRVTGHAAGGLMEGTYTPHHPEPIWKRAAVFAPNMRMIRIPVVLGAVIPAYFLAKPYLDKWRLGLRY